MLNFNLIKKLKLVFNIGGKKKEQTVGIWNTGKNNTFIGNIAKDFDIGMKDDGENTNAIDNQFRGRLTIGKILDRDDEIFIDFLKRYWWIEFLVITKAIIFINRGYYGYSFAILFLIGSLIVLWILYRNWIGIKNQKA